MGCEGLRGDAEGWDEKPGRDRARRESLRTGCVCVLYECGSCGRRCHHRRHRCSCHRHRRVLLSAPCQVLQGEALDYKKTIQVASSGTKLKLMLMLMLMQASTKLSTSIPAVHTANMLRCSK